MLLPRPADPVAGFFTLRCGVETNGARWELRGGPVAVRGGSALGLDATDMSCWMPESLMPRGRPASPPP
eukprot:gene3005-48023_t